MTVGAKICGLTSEAAIAAVAETRAKYAGFVFFPKSPRHLSPPAAGALAAHLPAAVKRVAVTVNATDAELEEIIAGLRPDFLQLHGDENAGRVAFVKNHFSLPVIKALPIEGKDDLSLVETFDVVADMLLFDAKAPAEADLPGGRGIAFDWTLLSGITLQSPWFLSGGLTPENVAEAVAESGASLVDVSSGVEAEPGLKDTAKIRAFMRALAAL